MNFIDIFGSEIFDVLNFVKNAEVLFGDMEEKRRNIGREGFAHINSIAELSKKGMFAIEDGDDKLADAIDRDMNIEWDKLINAYIPRRQSMQFEADAGQEIIEFVIVKTFYKYIIYGIKNYSKESLLETVNNFKLLSDPAWIAGLCDAIGELSKMVTHYITINHVFSDAISANDCLVIWRRLFEVIYQIYQYLRIFQTAYKACIDNSFRPGYFETFRGHLDNVSRLTNKIQEDILRLKLSFQ